ncbi:DNA replication protein DnaC [Breznakia sp. PF5-3]|uniref:IS21-like element helper ATPase IstB n=1 Tax=unclassified Breznakia TaxID=2623764 RepID=UPI0024060E6D|nr:MULTISPECIES: IS21-like element helper ATPase IstB [unclassified Breznakia]MDL2276834.1 IS21-like element helper ATPase IstB [Breznakia sp. OttesenSCG-928-G09]MDF9824461.1 DNA replication protein DnaC [Breznakia sp. PM6-1]MDF9835256.1 DNA replication protein DnaC [Breznakia sp. PF5-3]MDF9837416.1 DNA replication protein DnaC [Breznakia sp. PFB2-8]MDF9859351.1 DNA replication protein DnaC [Breznakia sp. PH5-24]
MSIETLAYDLRLPYTRHNHKQFIEEAKQRGLEIEEVIEELLQNEIDLRAETGITKRIQRARFTNKKYIVDFEFKPYKAEVKEKLKTLTDLSFIKRKENIILIGNPGTGKTHYAVALGIEACTKGHTVLFSSVPNLVTEMKEAYSLSQMTLFKRRFEKYDLVILDELGYVSFDKDGSEMLFNLLSNRNDKGSIIITTNLAFDRWEETFKDPVLTGAIIDRLAYKSHVIDMRGESYRIKKTQDWLGVDNNQK